MEQLNIYETKAQFSKLLAKVAKGEEIVIAKGNEPIAKLVPYSKPEKRKPGSAKGQIIIADDFDAPLPPSLLKYFT